MNRPFIRPYVTTNCSPILIRAILGKELSQKDSERAAFLSGLHGDPKLSTLQTPAVARREIVTRDCRPGERERIRYLALREARMAESAKEFHEHQIELGIRKKSAAEKLEEMFSLFAGSLSVSGLLSIYGWRRLHKAA